MQIETILLQKKQLVSDIIKRWHLITGGQLAVLTADGKFIQGYNGDAASLFENDIQVLATGQVQLLPQTEAITAPLVLQGAIKGHLISHHSAPEHQPLLAWVADTLLQYLANEQSLQGMTDELIAAWDQLELVYRITQTLAEKTNLSDALNSILHEIINITRVESAFLLTLHNNEPISYVSAGNKDLVASIAENPSSAPLLMLNKQVLFNHRAALLQFWPEAPKEIRNFVATFVPHPNRVKSEKNLAILGLINNHQRSFTAGDVKLITAVAEQIGAIINTFRLQQELILKERMSRELEIAAEIQESLLPKTIPQVTGLNVDVSILPAYEVGGDFYDFISTDDKHLTIVVGDVAGKGVPAAMFTAMVRTMLRIETYHSQEPHIIVKRVNEVLHEDLWRAELFVTAFVATFDTKNNVLMYANAGHTPGIIYHAQSKTSRLLKSTSLPFGIFGYAHKTTQYVHLSSEDTLVLYSDGVSEALSPSGDRFGIQRLQHLIHQHADKSPQALKQTILKELNDFQRMDQLADDITLVVIKFSQPNTRQEAEKAWRVLETFPFNYKADTAYLADISHQVTTVCRAIENLPPTTKGDDFIYLVELAVSEICTNMIEHAYAGQEGFITGQISLSTTGIQIDIYDQGHSFDPNAVPPPISDPADPTEGGYGLHIVRQIMDVAEYQANTPRGNHWKLIKYIPPA